MFWAAPHYCPTRLGGRGTEGTLKLVTGCVQVPPVPARPFPDAAGCSESVWSVPPLPNSGTHLVGLPHPTVVSNVLPESAVSVHLDGARDECGLPLPSRTHGPLCSAEGPPAGQVPPPTGASVPCGAVGPGPSGLTFCCWASSQEKLLYWRIMHSDCSRKCEAEKLLHQSSMLPSLSKLRPAESGQKVCLKPACSPGPVLPPSIRTQGWGCLSPVFTAGAGESSAHLVALALIRT